MPFGVAKAQMVSADTRACNMPAKVGSAVLISCMIAVYFFW